MKKVIFVLLLSSLSNFVFAESGWSQRGTVIEIYNLGFTVMVKLSGNFVSYAGACNSTDYYAIKTADSASFNSRISQILMAYASGKEIQFWVNGDTCSGQGNTYQSISSVKTF